jgi:uncharacterized membrane protein YvbJ
MALIKCKECGHEISDEALTCPNCGKPQKDKPSEVSISKQTYVYFVSLFLPPFGLWYVWKYLKQKDQKSKKIGWGALILTVVSLAITIWLTQKTIDSLNQSLNSFDILNNY